MDKKWGVHYLNWYIYTANSKHQLLFFNCFLSILICILLIIFFFYFILYNRKINDKCYRCNIQTAKKKPKKNFKKLIEFESNKYKNRRCKVKKQKSKKKINGTQMLLQFHFLAAFFFFCSALFLWKYE